MNNYKELIAELDARQKDAENGELVPPNVFQKSKYAIEQLMSDYEILAKMYAKVSEDLCVRTKKLDVAMIDVEFGRCCTTCLNYKIKNCPPNKCLTDDNDNWVWRGVSISEAD